MYSSPCNPTGAVFSREELAAIAEVLARHPQVYALADEIYEYINFVGEHVSLAQFDAVKDRVITVNGFSKGYAMTGWRVGYLAARREIAAACEKIQSQITSGTCSIAQRAGLAALEAAAPRPTRWWPPTAAAATWCWSWCSDIPGFRTNVPSGAFYLFPDVSGLFRPYHPGRRADQ